jgi:hypothetical protein
MKQSIFFIFLSLITVQSVAQDVSIEFSIEWKDKLDFTFQEIENGNIHPAFLNITYRNVSNKPLYCSKITEGKSHLPEIILFFDSIPHWDRIEKSWLRVNDDYFKRRYFVGFKSNSYYNMNLTWDIRNDTADVEYKIIRRTRKSPICDICFTLNENGSVSFNDDSGKVIGDTTNLNDWLFNTLNEIYNVIYHRYYPKAQEKIGKAQQYHYSTDVTQDTIMNNSIDKFVFLKPGETYVDKYNLIGFQITGGTFTFQMDDTKSLDYVETEPVYEDESKIGIDNCVKKQLPKKVGEYELFTGDFLTNKVTVSFPEIKLKE